jgi:serine/threonine protein kinase
LLGVGGFGVTYLALHRGPNTIHAVKEYFPTTMAVRDVRGNMVFSGKNDRRVFEHGHYSFKREAEFLKKFRNEPMIVQVSHSFEANGTTYFVMEYLDGVNLKALTRNMGGKIPYNLAFDILISMMEALKKIHQEGLIHRDISPENIFLTKNGLKKVIDFGAMRDYRIPADAGAAILLKPGFAPPEQYSNNGHQGPWTDIYALGVSFYYIVSGVKVPDARERLAGQRVAPLGRLVPEVGGELSAAIDKTLALDHKDRYQNVDELSRAIMTRPRPGFNMNMLVGQMSGTPYIMIERGFSQGEKWPIPQNIDIRIGRLSGLNNVVILDKSISREHCVIRYDNKTGCFILRDVSTNGTFTDRGLRYRRGENILLNPNSRFYLAKGNIMMKVGLG